MGLSRNKVAVSEGAAGSPPFYGESVRLQTKANVNDGRDKEENGNRCSIFKEREKRSLNRKKSVL